MFYTNFTFGYIVTISNLSFFYTNFLARDDITEKVNFCLIKIILF